MTNTSRPSFVASTSLIAAVLTVGGCSDSADHHRTEARKVINDVGQEFSLLSGSLIGNDGKDASAERLGKLRSFATRINGVNEGAPGQVAAASLLAASIQHEIGETLMHQANRMEMANLQTRSQLHSDIDLITALDGLAGAYDQLSTDDQRKAAQAAKSTSAQKVSQLRDEASQLEQPIDELRKKIDATRKKASSLIEESQKLKQKAIDLGALDGYPTFEQAAGVRQDANAAEIQIAQDQIQLAKLEPQHEVASMLIDMHQQSLKQLDDLLLSLDEQSQEIKSQAAACRKAADDFRQELESGLEELMSNVSGDLATAYADADTAFGTAASKARAAGGQGDAGMSPSRIEAANALAARADALTTRARGLAEHTFLLTRAVAVAGPAADARRTELEKAKTDLKAATEAADAAYSEAIEAFNQVNAPGDKAAMVLEGVKANLAKLADMAAGKNPVPADVATASSGMDAGSMSMNGFATVDELADYLRKIDQTDLSSLDQYVAITDAQTPMGRQSLELQTKMAKAFGTIFAAMKEKFPNESGSMMSSMGPLSSMMPKFSMLSITERTDTTAVGEIPGMPNKMHFRKTDSGWKVDLDQITPDEAAMMTMAGTMADGLTAAAQAFAEKVRGGAYPSFDAAMQALSSEMMAAMMGGAQMPDMSPTPDMNNNEPNK